jgi:DNA polymerase III epsilon subunit-like protein
MAKRTLYIDLETTGLDFSTGACILSIGAVVDKGTKKDPISEYYGLIIPTPAQWEKRTAEAMQVNGLSLELLESKGRHFSDARDEFLFWLASCGVTSGKAQVIGQNPKFDMGFLNHYMGPELRFIDFPFDEVFDNRDYYGILVNQKKVPYIKKRNSEAISAALGVEPEPWPHDALEGARVVKRNYEAMLALGVRDN